MFAPAARSAAYFVNAGIFGTSNLPIAMRIYCPSLKPLLVFCAAFATTLLTACSQNPTAMIPTDFEAAAPQPAVPVGADSIVLAAGCFWCTEAVFQHLPGVVAVTSGYLNGHVKNPTYEQVCGGQTGHAEALKVVYDPQKTSLEKLLVKFWKMHDPTTLNRQGGDSGTQYRSGIYFHDEAQKKIAEASKAEAQKLLGSDKIVTEIVPAEEFYPAENYHQNYYELNKNRNPYCSLVILPKLQKLGLPK